MRTPLAALALAMLLLGACGSFDDADGASDTTTTTTTVAATTTTTEAPEVNPYTRVATDICTQTDAWAEAVAQTYEAAPGAIGSATEVPAAKLAVIGSFDALSSHTAELVAGLEAIDLEGAEDLAPFRAELAGRYHIVNQIVEAHQALATELPDDDPETFGREVGTLMEGFNTALQAVPLVFEELDEQYGNPEMLAALAEACDL